jgi:AcrR family transcriptional regulator
MPRAGLTQTRVLEEAERLADEVGLSQLTLAALATRLGVRQPSLYKHIDGMDGLRRGLTVRAKNELANILARAAIGRERGDAITAIAQAYRGWAHEHPGRYAAAQPAPAADDAEDIAASQAVVSVVTAVLAGYRLRDDDAIDATRALRSALHGFVTLELSGGFGLPVDIDRSYERLVGGLVTALSSWTEQQAATNRRQP